MCLSSRAGLLRLTLTLHAVRKRSRAAAIASGGAKAVPISSGKHASPPGIRAQRQRQPLLGLRPFSAATAHTMSATCTRRMKPHPPGVMGPANQTPPRQTPTLPTISCGTTPSSSTMTPNRLAHISHASTSHVTSATPPVARAKSCRGHYCRRLPPAPPRPTTRAPSILPVVPLRVTYHTVQLGH